jgi:hypothetical protein
MWLLTKLLTLLPKKPVAVKIGIMFLFWNDNAEGYHVSGFTVPNGLAFCSNVRESG